MVHIFSDSTCDLSPELVEKYHIHILPLCVELGNDEYLDGVNITPEEIYAWSDAHQATPKTAACSLEMSASHFSSVMKDGDEIICFTISETMSTTGNVLRIAAEKTGFQDRIHVIDSENLSTGIGLLVLEAADMAANGAGCAEIISRMIELRPRVRASFVVDTLTYLHRGGRCGSVAALLGSTLKLHPRIEVADGRMAAGKKYRGKLERVILDYAKDMEPQLLSAQPDRVFITHSGCGEKTVEAVRQYLTGLNHFSEILITRAGATVSSHCGPGTLGVLFIASH